MVTGDLSKAYAKYRMTARWLLDDTRTLGEVVISTFALDAVPEAVNSSKLSRHRRRDGIRDV